jgi:hypothetical protein
MILTLGVGMAIFYEATGERKYWVNRWRLWRSLRAGRVKVEEINGESYKITNAPTTGTRFKMFIDDRVYSLAIYKKAGPRKMVLINEDNFTVSSWKPGLAGMMFGDIMIGLFTGSLLTNFLRRSSYRMLCDLTDPAKVREKKLEKIGI